jgi:hypothetical protein
VAVLVELYMAGFLPLLELQSAEAVEVQTLTVDTAVLVELVFLVI